MEKETGERRRKEDTPFFAAVTRLTNTRERFSARLRDDLHADTCGDIAMHLHGHLHLAERLDRIDQMDLALVHLESLRLERVRDVGGRHRSVHHVVLADAARDLDLELLQAL